jgi:uncharacterized protein DUF222
MSSPIARADDINVQIGLAHHRWFATFVEIDRDECWREDGAHDTAHWISMRFGVSYWKANRWLKAAHALERLPHLATAMRDGRLSVDKVVELARFATPESERHLVAWAADVAFGMVRRRADVEVRLAREDTEDVQRSRTLKWWWFDEGRRFALEGELPAEDGAVVAKTLDRLAAKIPTMPDEDGRADARRADALVALCAAKIAADPDPDRATVVVHANVRARQANGETEDGIVIPPETVQRLLCTSRAHAVIEDHAGRPVRLGETARLAPAWMLRQVRYRDRGCTFPACGATAGRRRSRTSRSSARSTIASFTSTGGAWRGSETGPSAGSDRTASGCGRARARPRSQPRTTPPPTPTDVQFIVGSTGIVAISS